MNDPRTGEVIAAVEARFPGSQVRLGLDPDPLVARIPIFTILLDAELEQRREAADFALELARRTFPADSVPFVVVCVTRETEARYQRDVAELLAHGAIRES